MNQQQNNSSQKKELENWEIGKFKPKNGWVKVIWENPVKPKFETGFKS